MKEIFGKVRTRKRLNFEAFELIKIEYKFFNVEGSKF